MRLDHIAWRTKDRAATSRFFIDAFGYKVQTEFTIPFDDEGKDVAQCIALEPPEKEVGIPWEVTYHADGFVGGGKYVNYHMAPEIFVSEGTKGSIVDEWLEKKNCFSGIHHFAYQVKSVEDQMKLWKEKGWADFSSEEPFKCEGLTQVFSKPHHLTGIVFEFIERSEYGFCVGNTKALMLSSKRD